MSVEATEEGVRAWEAEMAAWLKRGLRYHLACTPGFFNDEAAQEINPFGIIANRYNGGPRRFYSMLAQWRRAGTLEGVRLTAPHD